MYSTGSETIPLLISRCHWLIHVYYLLLFAVLPSFFPLWQSKQEPLTWISGSCCCYIQSCFEGSKSLILSTIQGSFLVPLIVFVAPLSHTSFPSVIPLSPSHAMFSSLTLFQGCSSDCLLSPSSLVFKILHSPSVYLSVYSLSLFPPLLQCPLLSMCLYSLSLSSLPPPQLVCFNFSSELPPSSV